MAWMVLARIVRWRDAGAEAPQPNHDVDEPHAPGLRQLQSPRVIVTHTGANLVVCSWATT